VLDAVGGAGGAWNGLFTLTLGGGGGGGGRDSPGSTMVFGGLSKVIVDPVDTAGAGFGWSVVKGVASGLGGGGPSGGLGNEGASGGLGKAGAVTFGLLDKVFGAKAGGTVGSGGMGGVVKAGFGSGGTGGAFTGGVNG